MNKLQLFQTHFNLVFQRDGGCSANPEVAGPRRGWREGEEEEQGGGRGGGAGAAQEGQTLLRGGAGGGHRVHNLPGGYNHMLLYT